MAVRKVTNDMRIALDRQIAALDLGKRNPKYSKQAREAAAYDHYQLLKLKMLLQDYRFQPHLFE